MRKKTEKRERRQDLFKLNGGSAVNIRRPIRQERISCCSHPTRPRISPTSSPMEHLFSEGGTRTVVAEGPAQKILGPNPCLTPFPLSLTPKVSNLLPSS